MTSPFIRLSAFVACLLTIGAAASGRAQAPRAAGVVEVFELRSRALEGNLVGDSPVRDVSVYLPPSYGTDAARRYPVVYLLHGFTDTDAKWFGRAGEHWINLPQVLDGAAARADVAETIVVMPNGFNAFGGSFYSTSVTIGDWESFVADELVAAIDSRYRTLAARASRGLAGHSMGGYGAIRLGLARPDVFSTVYAMSACCLTPVQAPATASRPSPAESIATLAQAAAAPFGVKAALALSAAWAPNPNRPPLYLDLPTESGRARPEVLARFAANAPVALVPQRVFALRRLTALAFDVGTRDGLQRESAALDRALTHHGIPHVYQTYDGDHLDGVAGRIETVVMPFFARHLDVQ
ncbi:MAG TPA: alpha/beta hydrolase-fold protein [Vicinamibacterales bacterium]|nr:alpha/beta hydrolase-fold protein [Vicinamibacterales bacterium]